MALEQARLTTLALTRATASAANEPTLVPGQSLDGNSTGPSLTLDAEYRAPIDAGVSRAPPANPLLASCESRRVVGVRCRR